MNPMLRLCQKIVLAIVAASLLAAVAGSYVAYGTSRRGLERSIASAQQALTVQTLDRIDRFLYERLADIRTIASDDLVRSVGDGSPDSEHLERHLSDYLTLTGPWEDLAVVDAGGIITHSTSGRVGENVYAVQEDGETFREAMTSRAAQSDATFDERLQRTTMVFAAPIRDHRGMESTGYVLIGHLAWPSVSEMLHGTRGTNMSLYNVAGHVIASSDSAQASERPRRGASTDVEPLRSALEGREGASVVLGAAGSDGRLVSAAQELGYQGYEGHFWTLVASAPLEQAFANVKSTSARTAAMLCVIILFGAFAASLLCCLLILPLGRLTRIVADSNLENKTLPKDLSIFAERDDEVGLIARAVIAMIAKFRVSQDERKRKLLGYADRLGDGGKVMKWKQAELTRLAQQLAEREKRIVSLKRRLEALMKSKRQNRP